MAKKEKKMKIKKDIDKLKKELYTYSGRSKYTKEDIVDLSMKLDKKINQYMKS